MQFKLDGSFYNTQEENKATLNELEIITEEKFSNCFQCGKCSGGCPAFEYMDLFPHQVILLAKLGQFERILQSKAIWVCTACYSCSSHCPQDIDPARIMEGFRMMGLRKKDALTRILSFKGEVPRQAYVGYYRKNFR